MYTTANTSVLDSCIVRCGFMNKATKFSLPVTVISPIRKAWSVIKMLRSVAILIATAAFSQLAITQTVDAPTTGTAGTNLHSWKELGSVPYSGLGISKLLPNAAGTKARTDLLFIDS